MNATYYRLEVLRFVRDRVGLFFTVGIPLFMYLVFGAAQSFGKENAGHGNVTFYIMVSMAAYGAKAGLLRECLGREDYADPARLAAAIKRLPVRLTGMRPMDEAISTAGGVRPQAMDERLMLLARPGVFCAGEMLDWDAPTGGYLLTACFAGGRAAAKGALAWLN